MRLRRHEICLRKWPPALDGVRVAVIADLHARAPHVDLRKLERLVAAVNRARPDVVVLLGDFADRNVALATPLAPEPVAQRVAHLRAPTPPCWEITTGSNGAAGCATRCGPQD